MTSISTNAVRDDFFHGKNGAVKLSEEELKFLGNLHDEVTMKLQREEGDATFVQQAQKIAEHYVAIVDGKQREIVGTTYNKLKEIISKINQSGYFDQVRECSETAPVEDVCININTHIKNTISLYSLMCAICLIDMYVYIL